MKFTLITAVVLQFMHAAYGLSILEYMNGWWSGSIIPVGSPSLYDDNTLLIEHGMVRYSNKHV